MEVEAAKYFTITALSSAFFFGALIMFLWGCALYASVDIPDLETREISKVFAWAIFSLYCIIQTVLCTMACVS